MSSSRDSKAHDPAPKDSTQVLVYDATDTLPTPIEIMLWKLRRIHNERKSSQPQTENTAANTISADDSNTALAEDHPYMRLFTKSATQINKITPVILNIPNSKMVFYDIPGIDEFPSELQELCLAYTNCLPEENVKYQYDNATTGGSFFAQYNLQTQYLAHRLEQAANDLLYDGNIDKALALIKQNNNLIYIETQGKDRLGRCIKGRTLLQMAAMAGDIDFLSESFKEETGAHGAVEIFAKAAKLTQDEVTAQLFPVLFSDEAKKANETRKNRILAVIKEFGESLIKRNAELPKNFKMSEKLEEIMQKIKTAQAQYQPEIDKLRHDLIRIASDEVMTCGYILDTQIYAEFHKWYAENLHRFERWSSLLSVLVCVNGSGTLQYVAAARDAQILQYGIDFIIHTDRITERTFKSVMHPGEDHFGKDSKLGLDFHFDCHHQSSFGYSCELHAGYVEQLVSNKNNSFAKLMSPPSPQSNFSCLVM